MPLVLAASLFFAEPAPLEMPRAEAYFVREGGRRMLEDRYCRADLWESQAVDGRWVDDECRVFLLANLGFVPPSELSAETTVTRQGFRSARVRANRKEPKSLREAIARLSGVAVAEKGEPIRQLPRGYRDVDYWQGTNRSAIVCAFLPERSDTWRLAVWLLAEDDDFDACREAFEDEFLADEYKVFAKDHPPVEPSAADERTLLRADARHSVSAYPSWRVTEAEEFSVLDDLPGSGGFVRALTNELTEMRARYAAVLPTGLDGSNVLCVARLYGSRTEYLEALERDGALSMRWSAAYWSSSRREIVAYLPEGGERELLRTFRHEAFHQYLAYAASMISVSPWLNEGYAQYFEGGVGGADVDDAAGLAAAAEAIPSLLAMDYREFYDGDDARRTMNYRLAHAVAVFLERGAPQVRFQPFKDVKRDYFEALFKSHDMRVATAVAFRDADTLKRFVAEWKKFWENR